MGRPTVRRLPAEGRRSLILQAARDVIVTRGLADASVREIAAAAGVSSGTVTHHFPTVDAILAGVVREESARFSTTTQAVIDAHAGALSRLLALGEYQLRDEPQAREHWRLWLDFWARAAHDPEMAAWQQERYDTWVALHESLIRDGVAAGELTAGDPARAAVELVAIVDGLGVQVFSHGTLVPAEGRRRYAAAVRTRLTTDDVEVT